MPDDLDYLWIDKLLSSPKAWTQEDAAAIEHMLKNQRDAVASLHPLDTKLREGMQGMVERMEEALTEYRLSRGHPDVRSGDEGTNPETSI